MERRSNSQSATDANHTGESVSFCHVSDIVTGWTFDFMFLSLCRHFKEDKLDEFNETLTTFEAISARLKGNPHHEKIMICAFLSRVMHGKQLDVQFEDEANVMPLMSAANIWSTLEDTVADESLFKNVATLLLVQSVAVCLEKGQRSSASSALKWFKNNSESSMESVGMKLSKIVAEMETYHPILMNFSFSRLLETVESYLDSYLEKNPSDFLLKIATKMVQSSPNMESLEGVATGDGSLPDTADSSTQDREKKENTPCLRIKRKLLSTKITDVWKPDSCRKLYVSVRRMSPTDICQMTSKKSENTPKNKPERTQRKAPQKWTTQQDKYLKHGVRCHGVGKWSRILMDYDFEGRTSVMLKDRWRVLVRTLQVS